MSATSIPSGEQRRHLPGEAGAAVGGAADVWDGPPVVIVHDWIGGVHGAERVLKELASLFPSAPILALMADRRVLPALGIEASRVHESYLGRIPNAIALRKVMLPFFADAVQTLDVGDASLIVSSSHAVAKNVPYRGYQRHLAYVHAPLRYAHDLMPQYLRSVPGLLRPLVRGWLRRLATWDIVNANRVTRFAANSRSVAERIRRLYRRRAVVVPPPVDVDAIPMPSGERGDYYVVLSRLEAYKRIDLAILAAAGLRRRLVVIGEGPLRGQLETIARNAGAASLVDFTGWVAEGTRNALLGGARALLFPGEEDFGIVGVEALAAGVPVVALGRGGMLDVVDSRRPALLGGPPRVEPGGVLVGEQTAEALVAGMAVLEAASMPDRAAFRTLAVRFSTTKFRFRTLELARRTLESP